MTVRIGTAAILAQPFRAISREKRRESVSRAGSSPPRGSQISSFASQTVLDRGPQRDGVPPVIPPRWPP